MKNLFIANNLKKIIKIIPIVNVKLYKNEANLIVLEKNLLDSLLILKNHSNHQYKMLSCINGVDYPNKKNRFKIVYELLSLRFNNRIKISVHTDELKPIKSSKQIFEAAGWYESEIWDMFGVFFQNHSNLTRLLTDYGFEGYPLRKDFPLSGFIEIKYNPVKNQISQNKIELSQGYKSFKFQSPWESFKI